MKLGINLKALTLIFLWCIFFPQLSNAQEAPYSKNQVIVKFKEGQSPSELEKKVKERQKPDKSVIEHIRKLQEDVIFKIRNQKKPEESIVELKKIVSQTYVKSSKEIIIKDGKSLKSGLHVFETDGRIRVEELLKRYKKFSGTKYVSPNYIVKSQNTVITPNDPSFATQWALQKIEADKAWVNEGISETIVAVIDTGIANGHEDLPVLISGPDYVNNDNEPDDDNGHGTHVAGVISAVRNNSIGIAGINQYAKLMSIKVLDANNSGLLSNLIQGIYYASDNNAKIINLSLGASGACPPLLQEAIDYGFAKNVTFVVASGNSDPAINLDTSSVFPAVCQNVIAVSALGPDNERAYYSSYGQAVDISAPGGNSQNANCQPGNANCLILSTYKDNSYALLQGTSMAAPQVAGVASLLLSKNPALTPNQILQILVGTGDIINTDFPVGTKLNANSALNGLIASQAPTPTFTPSPTPTSTPTPTFTPTPTPTPVIISKSISWTSQNPSSSQLEYGPTDTFGYTTAQINTSPRVTSHSITLSGLLPCTKYFYRTLSQNADNTIEYGSTQSFISDLCVGTSSVLSSELKLLNSQAGGAINLDQSATRGVTLSFPAQFSAQNNVNVQILRLEKDKVAQSIGAPANFQLIDPYVYDFKAVLSPTSNLTSFTQDIQVTVRFTTEELSSFNLATVAIARHNGSSWLLLPNCQQLNSPNRITCTTTQFSTFALVAQAQTSLTPSPTSSPTPTKTVTPTSAVCDPKIVPKAPDIFEIKTNDTEAIIYMVPAGSPVTYYFISYGVDAKAEGFGGEFDQKDSTGVVSFTVKSLKAGTTYFVKARGGNSCTTGEWSQIKSFKTTGGAIAGVSQKRESYSLNEVAATQMPTYILSQSGGTANTQDSAQSSGPTPASASLTELPKAGGGLVTTGIMALGIILMGLML
jgi:subtilisin family serine protease